MAENKITPLFVKKNAITYGDWSDYSNAVTFEVGKEIPTEEEETAEEEETSEEVEEEPAEEVEEVAEQE